MVASNEYSWRAARALSRACCSFFAPQGEKLATKRNQTLGYQELFLKQRAWVERVDYKRT